jgi:hypothetical protein
MSSIVISGDTSGTVTLQAQAVSGSTTLTLPTISGTVNLNPSSNTQASASSITPDINTYSQYNLTALAANLTINAPTGTPYDGQKLTFRLLDNSTSRTLTWNATYTAIGVTLPTSTTVSKTVYVGCVYNANNTRWDVVAVTTQV